ncbi:hypothetical protein BCR34DRAFT_583223 [Clohesyomyces aquaticus]|uniref:Uncharacterized protein n=1 Tax=Clohesyomyces aquaticus TaxID=1231657 RepID=A0A1Y2A607_9PLEO|nr:hypothetical protein BCR34DRAFT_583223 [Clohesyomyces aquaticus]
MYIQSLALVSVLAATVSAAPVDASKASYGSYAPYDGYGKYSTYKDYHRSVDNDARNHVEMGKEHFNMATRDMDHCTERVCSKQDQKRDVAMSADVSMCMQSGMDACMKNQKRDVLDMDHEMDKDIQACKDMNMHTGDVNMEECRSNMQQKREMDMQEMCKHHVAEMCFGKRDMGMETENHDGDMEKRAGKYFSYPRYTPYSSYGNYGRSVEKEAAKKE